ncbi:MAG: hypothetical protein KAH18_13305 [Psychromonas sp.]|nr:hypothetical protein [Psychromonas sp.]
MKVNNSIIIALLCISPFIFAGCGETSARLPPTNIGDISKIQGLWNVNCRISPHISAYPNTGTITFSENSMERMYLFYSGEIGNGETPLCSVPLYSVTVISNIVLGEVINESANDEHVNIDITGVKATITFRDANYINAVNQGNQINGLPTEITDWTVGVPRDITNFNISNTNINISNDPYNIRSPFFDIYQVTGNTLAFGDKSGNKDADGRPIALDTIKSIR